MTEADLKRMAELVAGVMKEHHAIWIDPEIHAEQHEFIAILLTERQEKLERRKALEDKIAGSLVLSFILGIVALLGAGSLEFLRGHLR